MVNESFQLEYADLRKGREIEEIERFLAPFDLEFEGAEFALILRNPERKIVGTGAFSGEVLHNIAVDETLQGEGLTASILSALMQEMARRGKTHYFLFTRPEKAFLFANLGFAEIAHARHAALLESGLGNVAEYCQGLAEELHALPPGRAAIVMNANPFTRGHRALAENAVAGNASVIVFVVSEDRSLIPFADRLQMVRQGLSDLPDVAVVPGGRYIISSATFPTYFTKKENRAAAHASLDIALFARWFVPALDIQTRYIGEEPASPVTALYNQAMFELLPSSGVAVRRIPRLAANDEIISASTVRRLIREAQWDRLTNFLPPSTLDYLQSAENGLLLRRIRESLPEN